MENPENEGHKRLLQRIEFQVQENHTNTKNLQEIKSKVDQGQKLNNDDSVKIKSALQSSRVDLNTIKNILHASESREVKEECYKTLSKNKYLSKQATNYLVDHYEKDVYTGIHIRGLGTGIYPDDEKRQIKLLKEDYYDTRVYKDLSEKPYLSDEAKLHIMTNHPLLRRMKILE